ncbi:MAG: FAD-dependent oxidoreductase [Candidatus Aenigmarchaeota archaeon]|nr:FAD-dependent oxidoreductase [Candidatus Aenigmarchaeota archaeon]
MVPINNNNIEPLKAEMCVPGNAKIYEFSKKHNIFYAKTGKLIIAENEKEAEFIAGLYKRSLENGVPGVEILDKTDVKRLEPNIDAYCALYAPETGIVDSVELARKLYQLAEENNACFAFGNKVIAIEPMSDAFKVTLETTDRHETCEIMANTIINAAGLYFDEITKLLDPDSPYEAKASKNKWSIFEPVNDGLRIKTNIYPIPCAVSDIQKLDLSFTEYERHIQECIAIRSLGVHLTPTVQGAISIGPMVIKGSGKDDFGLNDNSESLQRFLCSVSSFFPNLALDDIKSYQIGNQVKILEKERIHPDFLIKRYEKYPNFINVVGDSPGLTCVFPIAGYVAKLF